MIPALTLLIGAYVIFQVVATLDTSERPTPAVYLTGSLAILAAIGVVGYVFYLSVEAGNAMEEQLRQLQSIGF